MNNILVILNDPPYAARRGTMQVLSEGTLHADNALAFQ
jgi:hypothetical protein